MSVLSYLRPHQVLLHIPKTGGTWLGDVIAANRRWYEAPLVRQLSHGNSLARVDERFGPTVKVGFVFRDPVARLHSAFDSRRNFSRPTRNTPWTEAETACFTRFSSFDAFARAFGENSTHPDRVAAEAALAGVGHFKRGLGFFFGDHDRLLAARNRVLFCAETQNVRRLLPDFARAYGIRPLREPETARSHSSAAFRTECSDDARAMLRDRLQGEYALYDLCRRIEADLHGASPA